MIFFVIITIVHLKTKLKMKIIFFPFLSLTGSLVWCSWMLACPIASAEQPASEISTPSPRVEASPSQKFQKFKKPTLNLRDAEGTQAPNLFDEKMNPKSRYELDGQALEIDTD